MGCASGHATITPTDGDITPTPDGMDEIPSDAPPTDATVMVDAKPIDAHVDAPSITPPDAYQCQTMTRQLLMNPVLDLTPSGMGWIQQNIDNAYPIITDQDGLAEQSPPFKAWMGGFVAPTLGGSVTDVLYQDVTVPMGTTQLRLTGYYAVGTQETGSIAYDSGSVALTQTNGTPIETVISLSNVTPVATWTALDKVFTTNVSGQTVRLRFTSTNDDSLVTNFFYDTLALTATYCQ
ncbi:MAG TPA: hypothetical protein VIV40_38700 [Kofleriaceae bacterium]